MIQPTTQIRYPIAELFDSIQGEGSWVGTPMHFIRLAGCSVGKPYRHCKTAFGVEFYCDTEYKATQTVTASELADFCQGANHVCITGGEPFDHNLAPIIDRLHDFRIRCHIETSGTCPFRFLYYKPWITLSPKLYLPTATWVRRSHELKWLISAKRPLHDDEIQNLYHRVPGRTFVQPIWHETEYESNVSYAVELCKKYKGLRLSLQVHKWIKVP